MNSLGPESRAIIDEALPGEGLEAPRRAHLKRELMARIAAGAVAGGAALATTKAAAATQVAKGGLVSLFLTSMAQGGAVMAVVIGAGVGYRAVTEPAAAPAPSVALSVAITPTASAIVRPAAPRAVEEPVSVIASSAPAAPVAPTASMEAAAPASSSISGEMELLRQAQRALASGDGSRALELLGEHEASYAGGALREERQAARVLALCKAGRGAEARAEASRFVAEFPRSLHRGHVLGACAND
jgi:hypothetical protein